MALTLSAEGFVGMNQPLLAPGGIYQAAIQLKLFVHMSFYGVCGEAGVAFIQFEGLYF